MSSGWMGSGLTSQNGLHSSVLAEVSDTDFTGLTECHSGSDERGAGGTIFTTSICGQFLLVSRDTMIYIYDLGSGTLMPATSVVCPRRVLAMSMDMSSGRNAVAALLEGRMGMVCELRFAQKPSVGLSEDISAESNDRPYQTIASSAPNPTSHVYGFGTGIRASDRRDMFNQSSNSHRPYIESVDVQSNYQAVSLHRINDQRTHAQNYINQAWNLDLQGPRQYSSKQDASEHSQGCCALQIENGTSTFYRHLCCEDDPPRSGTYIFMSRNEHSQDYRKLARILSTAY